MATKTNKINNSNSVTKSVMGGDTLTWFILHMLFIFFFVGAFFLNPITNFLFDVLEFLGTQYLEQLVLIVTIIAIDLILMYGTTLFFGKLNNSILKGGAFALVVYFVLDAIILQTNFPSFSLLA